MRALPPLLAGCATLALLAGCVRTTPATVPPPAQNAAVPGGVRPGTARVAMVPNTVHVPDFARKPYEPFSRADAVAIALREWRMFGQPVDDAPPGNHPEPPAELKPERMPGLWQRVGEYWFEGLDANAKESLWTGKHDEWGLVFPAGQDASYAWSAAFISYVMRIAGAGDRFPYSSIHADYINLARQQGLDGTRSWVVTAEAPWAYPAQAGDLICTGRDPRRVLRYEDLPTPSVFPGHCDIVVGAVPGQLTVLGGNVDDAVTMKHVPTTPDGMLAAPDGRAVDTRYPWVTVLRVAYDR